MATLKKASALGSLSLIPRVAIKRWTLKRRIKEAIDKVDDPSRIYLNRLRQLRLA